MNFEVHLKRSCHHYFIIMLLLELRITLINLMSWYRFRVHLASHPEVVNPVCARAESSIERGNCMKRIMPDGWALRFQLQSCCRGDWHRQAHAFHNCPSRHCRLVHLLPVTISMQTWQCGTNLIYFNCVHTSQLPVTLLLL